jgi:paraquat-inducible protein A
MTESTALRHPNSLAAVGTAVERLIGPALLVASGLLVLGWVLPFMTVRTFFVFSGEVSILGAMLRLWDGGEHVLFVILVVFTVLFPLAKMTLAFAVWLRADRASPTALRLVLWVEGFGRWSMLDVFLAALLVVTIKTSIGSDVWIHSGIYVFAGAVVLSMLAVQGLAMRLRRQARAP